MYVQHADGGLAARVPTDGDLGAVRERHGHILAGHPPTAEGDGARLAADRPGERVRHERQPDARVEDEAGVEPGDADGDGHEVVQVREG